MKLSIIIPCFNSEATLEDAVSSIYRQAPAIEYDVTMVDDGSRDGTYRSMQRLAGKYSNIRILQHPTNRGGGAARNTAIAGSDGDLIFCLDSDDILGPGFLENMTRFWMEKQCDGVGISKSIKFRGRNIDDVAYITDFEGIGQKVRLESVLDSSICSLYSTFLITRMAFSVAGGYPTDHGFDTQGMAFRFLCNGLSAYTSPNTIYYHRVNFHESYYLREAQAGRDHWGMFKVLNEFLYVFTEPVKARILDYPLFPAGAQKPLLEELRNANAADGIWSADYQELVRIGRDHVAERLETSENAYDQYWLGAYSLSKGSYPEALDYFVKALKSGFNHRIIYCWLLEAAARSSGMKAPASFALGDLIYYVNDPARSAESAASPLSSYQRLENKMLLRPGVSLVGRLLKSARLSFQHVRGKKTS